MTIKDSDILDTCKNNYIHTSKWIIPSQDGFNCQSSKKGKRFLGSNINIAKNQDNKPSNIMPIKSYGIILFTLFDNQIKYLIYQRRDTYEYMEFLRGLWNTEEQAKTLINGMTLLEKDRLLKYNFKELWDDLWVKHSISLYTYGMKKAQDKFNLIKDNLSIIINNIKNPINIEPQWGFPKGKKNTSNNETNIDCAIREFEEETNITKHNINFWKIKPYSEVYDGGNNKLYSTYYYLAESPELLPFNSIQTPHCIRKSAISEEAAELAWVTYEEALLKLNVTRQNILRQINLLVNNHYKELSPIIN